MCENEQLVDAKRQIRELRHKSLNSFTLYLSSFPVPPFSHFPSLPFDPISFNTFLCYSVLRLSTGFEVAIFKE